MSSKKLSEEQIHQAKLIRRRFQRRRRKLQVSQAFLSQSVWKLELTIEEDICLRKIGVMYNDMQGDNKTDCFVPFHPEYYEIQTQVAGEPFTLHRNIMEKRCCSKCGILNWVKMYDVRTKKETASNYVECYKCKTLTKFPDHVLVSYGLLSEKGKIINKGRAKRGW